MKKFLTLIMTILFSTNFACARVVDFSTANSQAGSKPALVFVYADWGSKQGLDTFKTLESKYANNANFVELDITKPESATYFDKYAIHPKLPQILMFKGSGGKLIRFIPNDCVNNSSCLSGRVKLFLD